MSFTQAWLPLIIALTLNAAANVLMKVGARLQVQLGPDASLVAKVLNFLNWSTLLGIGLFAANVLVYRKALDHLDISVAYPIMVSVGMILVAVSAATIPLLSEKITPLQIGGMVMIAAGVWMVART